MNCNSTIFNSLLYPIKNILNLLLIICPILVIIILIYIIIKALFNPDDKKIFSRVKNIIISLVIIYFIPIIVNCVMYIMGSNFSISECWLNAEKNNNDNQYIKLDGEDDKKSIFTDPSSYEKGVPKQLNFSSADNSVESIFSDETLRIVKEHLNDFNYYNFKSFMSSHGGASNYIKSLGGVFSEFNGKKVKVSSVYDFQRVSEYVFGLMYIYGFDYYNGNKYCKWGGSCSSSSSGTSDAFYPGTMKHTSEGLSEHTNFDSLIEGRNEINMTTNCNWTVDMVYMKAGIWNKALGASASKVCPGNVVKNVTDLRVGDVIHFYNSPINKNNSSSFKSSGWFHVAYVGEVYDDKVVVYDGGSFFTNNRNFKWSFERNNNITSLNGMKNWLACHVVDLS